MMFKAVIVVRQVADSNLTLEGHEKKTRDEALEDLEISKKIWENDFIKGEVVEC